MKESMDNWPTNGPDNPLEKSESEPAVRSKRWLSRIVRYFVRRDISKALDRLRSARNGASLYDGEAVRFLNEAENYLRCARARMRDNSEIRRGDLSAPINPQSDSPSPASNG